MHELLLTNCDAVLSEGVAVDSTVATSGGSIAAIGGEETRCEREIDLRGATLFPGFIDIHCHGAAGADVNSADAVSLARTSGFLAKHGVTGWVPTLVPDSNEAYISAVGAIDELARMENNAADVLGVHYEGLFASRHRCGALRPEYFRDYVSVGFDDLPVPAFGAKLMTLAPESDRGVELVRDLEASGWKALIGHTEAPLSVLESAFDAGARHLTHLFNAMTGLHHRDLGVAGWGMTRGGVTFDIIADGRHVAPAVLELAIRARGVEEVLLISDSVSPSGMGDGEYELWGKKLFVEEGTAKTHAGTISGSVITLLDAVNLCLSLGFTASDAALMSSANPARLLGIDLETGSIEVGKRADLVALRDGKAVLTVVGGRIVHEDL